MRVSAIVLAAGEAKRFGSAKQLARVEGRTLVQHAVDAVADGGVDEVVVVLGARADEIEPTLVLPPRSRAIRNPDFAAGQSTSLAAGIRAVAPEATAAVVVLADQPGVTADDVRAVVDAQRTTGADLVRASYRGSPGHPVAIGRARFAEVLALRGDIGARELFGTGALEVPIDRDPPGDVDTPDDLTGLTRTDPG